MRAHEFIIESASSGATTSGNVATVVKPLQGSGKETFFGANPDDFPPYGSTAPFAIIRRPSPFAELKNKRTKKAR